MKHRVNDNVFRNINGNYMSFIYFNNNFYYDRIRLDIKEGMRIIL